MSNQSHYHQNQPGQYTPPPTPPPYPPKKKMPTGVKILIGVLAVPALLIGGCTAMVAGSGLANEAAKNADTAPVPGAQSTYDPGIETPLAQPTTQPTAQPSPKVTHKPAPPALVPTDGTLLVGKDVKPGTYQTHVLADDFMPMCYWKRLEDLDDNPDSIIANDLVTTVGALVTLTVKRTDYAVSVDCGGAVWTKVS